MLYLTVALAALARFAPHPPDFSPAYAALLFGGACLRKRDSIWFPVVVLAVSDFLLTTVVYGMHFGWADTSDWVGFAAVALIGWGLRNKISVKKVVVASLASGTAFFIISNFGVWLGGLIYPRTLTGLGACFVAALPFFGNTLLSSVLFSGVLFGAYEFYRRRARRLSAAAASTR
jgi:hypothetical protein